MSNQQRMAQVRDLIWFYDLHGWDWVTAVAFLLTRED